MKMRTNLSSILANVCTATHQLSTVIIGLLNMPNEGLQIH